MDSNKIKKKIQGILGDGLVIVAGCGLSCAEGLPGMTDLANHLIDTVPDYLSGEESEIWSKIERLLHKGLGLEEALAGIELTFNLNNAITNETSKCIGKAEKLVINDVINGQKTLRFSHLVHALPPSPSSISILTTNYDRLIEIACEHSGKPVDSTFVGHSIARFDPKESQYSKSTGSS